MGCSNGKTVEKQKNGNGKFTFPKCVSTFELDNEVYSMLTVDSSKVLLGMDKEVKTLEIGTKNITPLFAEHTGRVNSMLKLKSGQIATASQDKSIKVWNLSEPQSKMTLTGHTSMIWSMIELEDGKILSGADDRKAIVWNLQEQKEEFTLYEGKNEISSVLQVKSGKVLTGSGEP